MEFLDTMGLPDRGIESFLDGWKGLFSVQFMQAAASSWETCPAGDRNAFRNQQFLADFALHLVQQFRTEEAQLKQARSPQLASRCRANHGLALQLRGLMAEVDQGLEATTGIQAFLGAWRRHQAHATASAVTPGTIEH